MGLSIHLVFGNLLGNILFENTRQSAKLQKAIAIAKEHYAEKKCDECS